MACEDYPCCGHEAGDCPTLDRRGRPRFRCVECGKTLRPRATSSICAPCLKRLNARAWSGEDDFDTSMNY